MSTEPFTFKAGTGIGISEEDETLLLFGAKLDQSVKWVKLPDDIGGERIPVVSHFQRSCISPACSKAHNALKLDKIISGKRVYVIECGDQYFFYAEKD